MANETRLVLYGAGGHAGVVLSVARSSGLKLNFVFADDMSGAKAFATKKALTAVGPEVLSVADNKFHLAIGKNLARQAIVERFPLLHWFSIRHPSAIVADDAQISHGVFIGAGAIVQTGAKIGRHVIVNTGAIVEHDCVVGDYSHVAPGSVLSGEVVLGEGVLIGAGATVMKGRGVEAWTEIGAGAVVVKDVVGFKTATGIPARGQRRK